MLVTHSKSARISPNTHRTAISILVQPKMKGPDEKQGILANFPSEANEFQGMALWAYHPLPSS